MSIELPGRLESSFEHAGIPTVHAGSGQVPLCACVSCVCRVVRPGSPFGASFYFSVILMLRGEKVAFTLVDTEARQTLFTVLRPFTFLSLAEIYGWTILYTSINRTETEPPLSLLRALSVLRQSSV